MSKLLDTSKTIQISDKDIKTRAKQVIKYAKDNNYVGVISIFKNISLPFNNENNKRKVFEKIFELADIECYWDDDLGLIVPSEKRTKRTVVSHMDLINPFNKGFAQNKTHEIKDGKIYGALDNTFTNAVVINSILNKKASDTTYLFTLDEETTQYAIRDYMKRFGIEQFIINLDITNEGTSKNMSIEYDEPSWNICKQISDNMKKPFFTTDRVCDDLDEVIKAKGYGLSYCLPTKGNIHSYKNNTELSKIEPYMEGLDFLVHELDLTSYVDDIEHLSIDKAIEFKTFSEFKEKDVRKVYVSKTKTKSAYKKPASSFNIDNRIRKYNFETKGNKEFSKSIKKIIKEFDVKEKDFFEYAFNKSKNSEYFSFYVFGSAYGTFFANKLLRKGFIQEVAVGRTEYTYRFVDKKVFSKKKKKVKDSTISKNFIRIIEKNSSTDVNEIIKYAKKHSSIDNYFTLNDFLMEFPFVDFQKLMNNSYILNADYGGTQLMFNPHTLYEKEKVLNKEIFHKFILDMTNDIDTTLILKMKNFLEDFKNKDSFTIENIDTYLGDNASALYSLEGFEIFKYIKDDIYSINYSFMNTKLFKAWEIATKRKNINAVSVFNKFCSVDHIEYSTLVEFDKKRDLQNIDGFISQLLNAKVLSMSKNGGFKIKK